MSEEGAPAFILYKAQAASADEEIPDLELVARESLPSSAETARLQEYLETSRARYKEQATHISSALSRSLPGGTLDALLVMLLERRASLLAIPLSTVTSTKATQADAKPPLTLATLDAFIEAEAKLAKDVLENVDIGMGFGLESEMSDISAREASEKHQLRANVAKELRALLEKKDSA